MRRMAHHHRWLTRGIAVALTVAVAGLTGVSAAQQKGRYKKEGERCVWNSEDSGPNQCTPALRGRFKKSGDALTGQATYEHSMGKGTVALQNLKVDGDKVSFDEPLTIDGNTMTITYSGTLAGDELKLTRVVGNFGTEQLTAKRAAATK